MTDQLQLLSTSDRIEGGADLSTCGRYRPRLWRRWSYETPYGRLGWVMLNPSTADGDVDDPTIRRCIGFSQDAGYGSLEVVNLYPFRATDPAALRRDAQAVIEGPEPNVPITSLAARVGTVVAAWGAIHRDHWPRAMFVYGELRDAGVDVVCLGTTKDGWPRHPLFVRADQPFVSWSIGEVAS